jgi:hypothetical protein
MEVADSSIPALASKEKWSLEHRDQQLAEMWGLVEDLLKWAVASQQVPAITKWTREVHKILPEAQEQADEVLEEKSSDYRLEEVDFFMQEFGTWSWQLDKLLVRGAAASFTGQTA